MVLSGRAVWIFAAIMALTSAELGWWITFNIRALRRERADHLQQLDRDRSLAAELIVAQAATRMRDAPGPPIDLPERVLQQHFPALQWRPGAFEHMALNMLYPGQGIFARAAELDETWHQNRPHIRMFVMEGLFFFAMVLLGGALIFRSMRRDVNLIRQQGNFLSAVTHELKSPLAAIRLYIETMQLRQLSAEESRRYLHVMRQDVDRLDGMVGNLLAAARLEADQVSVDAEQFDLAQALRYMLPNLREELQERGVAVTLHNSDTPIWVRMDRTSLTTIVRNLIDNAAKYGRHPDKPIEVCLQQQGEHACLDVRDYGIGIAPHEIKKIFDKFYRVGDEMVRQTAGSGLGLYLVRSLVEQCGGKVEAHSDGVGTGTLMRLRLACEHTTPETGVTA